MKRLIPIFALLSVVLTVSPARADEYQETISAFKQAAESGIFFNTSYGYAVFPRIGQIALGPRTPFVGGNVYEKGQYVGYVTLMRFTIGRQFDDQVYREIVFFEDQRSFKEFTSGNFVFGADASAVAITVAWRAKTNVAGASIDTSAETKDAKIVGAYNNGMATFTVAEDGQRYRAPIDGQKMVYEPRR